MVRPRAPVRPRATVRPRAPADVGAPAEKRSRMLASLQKGSQGATSHVQPGGLDRKYCNFAAAQPCHGHGMTSRAHFVAPRGGGVGRKGPVANLHVTPEPQSEPLKSCHALGEAVPQ